MTVWINSFNYVLRGIIRLFTFIRKVLLYTHSVFQVVFIDFSLSCIYLSLNNFTITKEYNSKSYFKILYQLMGYVLTSLI